jgi:hypothetical protein
MKTVMYKVMVIDAGNSRYKVGHVTDIIVSEAQHERDTDDVTLDAHMMHFTSEGEVLA